MAEKKLDGSRCLVRNEPDYVWMKNWVTFRVPLKQPAAVSVNARPLLSNFASDKWSDLSKYINMSVYSLNLCNGPTIG